MTLLGHGGHSRLWTQSAKLTADSVGHVEIAGDSRLNTGQKRLPQFYCGVDPNQREGMGLQEYQATPSLRDVAHDRWLYFITLAGNSISSQLGSSCQGNRYGTEKQVYGPFITYKITLTWSLFFGQMGRRVGPAL